jgi:hypothetical protein
MVAFADAQGWDAQVVLNDPDVLCFHGVPLISMVGAWDPAAGGSLHGTGLVHCFGAAQAGASAPWRICRAVFAVCDEATAFEVGTATLLYA